MPQLLQRSVAPSRVGGKSVAPGSAALGAPDRLQRAIGNRELARLVGAHRERSAQLDDEIATARGGAARPALGALDRLQRAIGNRELARLVGAHRERSAQLDDEIATARGGAARPAGGVAWEPMPLQRVIGKRAARELLVGAHDDPSEREADRVARDVIARLQAPPGAWTAGAAAGVTPFASKRASLPPIALEAASPAGSYVDGATAAASDGARSGAVPSPARVRTPMERAFGVDFGDVRVHANAGADRLNRSIGARAFTSGRDLAIARSPAGPLNALDRGTSASIRETRSSGQPIPDALRRPMEEAFGADFRAVRLHVDHRADALNRRLGARAFTTGRDLFFKRGEYDPASRQGQELIAHELTHVVQQGGGAESGAIQGRLDGKDHWKFLAMVEYMLDNNGFTGPVAARVMDDARRIAEQQDTMAGARNAMTPLLPWNQAQAPPSAPKFRRLAKKPEVADTGETQSSQASANLDDTVASIGRHVFAYLMALHETTDGDPIKEFIRIDLADLMDSLPPFIRDKLFALEQSNGQTFGVQYKQLLTTTGVCHQQLARNCIVILAKFKNPSVDSREEAKRLITETKKKYPEYAKLD